MNGIDKLKALFKFIFGYISRINIGVTSNILKVGKFKTYEQKYINALVINSKEIYNNTTEFTFKLYKISLYIITKNVFLANEI